MKKMKRILMTNWLYFSKELVEIGDINFLTGKNGAGKSTFIDALQIVLLGELNARNFNKAASDSSRRTLDGYLRANLDDNNPKSRRGKDFSSYIACEFCDEIQEQSFVIGVVFDCRADGSQREQFFTYNGVIPDECFIENTHAMDIASLRSYLKNLPKSNYVMHDSNQKYKDDILAKWNVHTEQVFRMLKKAVSFRPIVDIQKFITENICDAPDKPDIDEMQQNIRAYERHKDIAKRQEEKLSALKEIGVFYREMQSALDRLMQQRFITMWAEKCVLESKIQKLEHEKNDCVVDIEHEASQYRTLQHEYEEKTKRRDELITDRATNDIYQEKVRLEEQLRQLEKERRHLIEKLNSTALEMKKEATVLCNICSEIEKWPQLDELTKLQSAAGEIILSFQSFRAGAAEVFSTTIDDFERAQIASTKFSACLQQTLHALEKKVAQLKESTDKNEGIIVNLNRNIKDYPAGLLQLRERMRTQMSKEIGCEVHIEILSDALEIVKGAEEWRGVVEGYLNTQKFHLLVEPEFYEKAIALHDQWKREYGRQSFGLVDVGKLREKENWTAWDDSLAKKVQTDHPLARSYVDFLLGRVVCCTHFSQLRKHRTAVTMDGMLYQGYAARPLSKNRMEDVFIGQQAIALRLERLQKQQTVLQEEIASWAPYQAVLSPMLNREYLFSQRFVQGEMVECRDQHLRGLEINTLLEETKEKISGCNIFWLEQMQTQIQAIEAELATIKASQESSQTNKGIRQARLKQLEYDELPALHQQLSGKEHTLSEDFSQHYRDAIGIPRFQQELQRLRRATVVAKNFGDSVPQSSRAAEQCKRKLFDARSDYTHNFQPCSFRIDSMDNDEYEKERKLIEENELPSYREKIRLAKESAHEQFQNDFLARLKSSIEQVRDQVNNLNRALKQTQFGTDSYEFKVEKNPDYSAYYDMIMAPELMEGEGGLFALPFQQKYAPLIKDLFDRIADLDDSAVNARKQSELQKNIDLYTDFRTYLKFDLQTTDQNGSIQMLSQTLNTKSGGETQTPFYIAVLASFAQLYHVNDLSNLGGNTARLVVFDEAFNKMDSDRIIESVRLLRKLRLQAIICTPPDKLPDIAPEADKTLLVCKEKYSMHILQCSKGVGTTWNS